MSASSVRNAILGAFILAGFFFLFMHYSQSFILSQAGQTPDSVQVLGLSQFFEMFAKFGQYITLGSLGLVVLGIILIPVYASQRKKEKQGRATGGQPQMKK
ncbi:MAG: hypothetical protein ABIA21_03485 [Candidatus Aenigmatarchaeota archaeon]